MIKDLLKHDFEIIEAREHQPPVYIVKLLIKNPFLSAVLAFECTIGRAIVVWLDQAQIRTNHVGFWMFSGELHRPDAGARANVQNISGLSNRRNVQPLTEKKFPPAVLEIWICGQH